MGYHATSYAVNGTMNETRGDCQPKSGNKSKHRHSLSICSCVRVYLCVVRVGELLFGILHSESRIGIGISGRSYTLSCTASAHYKFTNTTHTHTHTRSREKIYRKTVYIFSRVNTKRYFWCGSQICSQATHPNANLSSFIPLIKCLFFCFGFLRRSCERLNKLCSLFFS